MKKLYINLPFNLDSLKYTTIPPLQNLTIPFEVFTGYDGYSSRIWNLITKLIKLILRSDENISFGIGSRQDRSISIIRNNNEMLIPNIFQLSTGQTSVLNIVLSILKDFDMSGAIIESLDNISGVVIIDEVDAHLHADLQCNLLPEVISIFPKVQFILTTHSPLFLLGMKEKFKDVGFDILSLPTGQKIDIEEFEEFQTAFDFYKESNTFRHKIEFEVNQSQKAVIFVEGDYDIKYLRKAASLLGKESILEKIDLKDGDGYGNLNNIWNVCKDSKIPMAFPRIIGLIYDCDVKKIDDDRNFNSNRHRAKKRGIPSISDSPISKGIENLIPVSRINNLRESHAQFFDVKPKITIFKAGKPIEEAEICEINKNQKSNLCKWLCENGTTEDFAQFESVFNLIEEIAELNNQQISLENEKIENNFPDPLST